MAKSRVKKVFSSHRVVSDAGSPSNISVGPNGCDESSSTAVAATCRANMTAISAGLHDLKEPPGYRGLIDEYANGKLRGWCLSTTDPTARVTIEAFLGDIKIGTFFTGMDRLDIERLVSLPVAPGFSFDLQEELANCGGGTEFPQGTLSGLITLCIAGESLSLTEGPNINWTTAAKDAQQTLDVTDSLMQLDQNPPYRGMIDFNKDSVISGWCLNGRDSAAPVQLEVYLGQTLLGFTTTCKIRPEISKRLQIPVTSGFTFGPDDCASSGLPAVLKAISEINNQAKHLSDLVSVRVKGTRRTLPFSKSIEATNFDLESLYKALNLKFQQVFNNGRHQIRESLLDPPASSKGLAPEDVHIIAFYLPQFHPVSENNEWWGEGFTEWTNVVNASPLFKGHHQPRIPADLGYYDLRLDATHRKQVDLAKRYGISAFCYYYYWFSGTTLLSMVVDRHCEQNLDLNFCLCWANENWSRRWDGSDADILMSQQHSESDDETFIHAVIKYFKHERYIKIDGAPVLVIYRISLLSSPNETIAKWKRSVIAAGFPDLHICMAETFGLEDPLAYGADSSCQFPPHGVVAESKNP